MFRYRSHKQAFIMTALVILLCLVCLTGATLALFTNDRNDGTIGVVTTAGYIDIDIVDTNDVTLQDKALAFITTSGSQKDSKDVWFEPGAIFRTQCFRIQNNGNVPVNFSFSISKDENVDLDEFNEAFELWIIKDGDDLSNAVLLTEFKAEGLKGKTSSDDYYIIIRMKETVDNDFQGKTYTGMGVTVYAVQGNVPIK